MIICMVKSCIHMWHHIIISHQNINVNTSYLFFIFLSSTASHLWTHIELILLHSFHHNLKLLQQPSHFIIHLYSSSFFFKKTYYINHLTITFLNFSLTSYNNFHTNYLLSPHHHKYITINNITSQFFSLPLHNIIYHFHIFITTTTKQEEGKVLDQEQTKSEHNVKDTGIRPMWNQVHHRERVVMKLNKCCCPSISTDPCWTSSLSNQFLFWYSHSSLLSV